MELQLIDWLIIAIFFILSFGISLIYRNESSKDLKSFFLGSGNLPWYLAGISMVATTFAADTPLAVTEIVRKDGVSGNWLWWNLLAGGLLTTFFFAKLWKRSGVLTEAEFIELRYDGQLAKILRGFKAFYLGFFMNILVIGWVNIALVSILTVFFDLTTFQAGIYTILAMAFVALYASIGGLKGIIITDSIQFILAMIGSITLAYFVLDTETVNGLSGLSNSLSEKELSFIPSFSDEPLKVIVFLGMMWWASWYPGAEPGGGGYIAQRMMSTKNEKHAIWATLFFQVGHYALRPWPWIIVGMAAMLLYPDLTKSDFKLGYVYAIKDYLPKGIKGLMLTAFFAAYMSTISTQLNWGTSYLINDLYKRFIAPEKSNKHYLNINWLFTFVLIVIGGTITFFMDSISAIWEFLMLFGAGLGLVLILRWYWWKISALSELVAMVTPALCAIFFSLANFDLGYEMTYILTVGITTFAWISITLIYPSQTINQDFLTKVKPSGWWNISIEKVNEKEPFDIIIEKQAYKTDNSKLGWLALCWILSIFAVYNLLFGMGNILLKDTTIGLLQLIGSLLAFGIIFRLDKNKQVF